MAWECSFHIWCGFSSLRIRQLLFASLRYTININKTLQLSCVATPCFSLMPSPLKESVSSCHRLWPWGTIKIIMLSTPVILGAVCYPGRMPYFLFSKQLPFLLSMDSQLQGKRKCTAWHCRGKCIPGSHRREISTAGWKSNARAE